MSARILDKHLHYVGRRESGGVEGGGLQWPLELSVTNLDCCVQKPVYLKYYFRSRTSSFIIKITLIKLRYHIVYTLPNSPVKTQQFKVQIIHLLVCVWLASFNSLFPLNILFFFFFL